MIRILLADDHDLVRESIAAFLCGDEIKEVKTVANFDDALAAVKLRGGYDLVLLDYNMPGMQGLQGLHRMMSANTTGRVAILSGSATREVADAAMKAGAQGFIPKTLSARSFVTAAKGMASGEVFAPLDFLHKAASADQEALTRRELEVLRGICEAKANKEIARDLDLQEVTVKLHVKTLSRKLGARNRTHAAMIARDQGLA